MWFTWRSALGAQRNQWTKIPYHYEDSPTSKRYQDVMENQCGHNVLCRVKPCRAQTVWWKSAFLDQRSPGPFLVTVIIIIPQVDRTTLRTKIAIPETVRQDKGNYKLVAENCFGKAQHVIRVEILGKTKKFFLFPECFRLKSHLHIKDH